MNSKQFVTKSELDDFVTLEKIIRQQIDIKDVDLDTKKRIIELCKQRLNEINIQIREKDTKILKMKKMIEELKTLEGKHT